VKILAWDEMTRVPLALLVVAPIALASAQQEQPSAELVRTRITVSDSGARTRCTVIPHRELYVDPPIEHGCRVIEFDTLPRAGGNRWSYVVQRHTSVYKFSDSAGVAQLDTILETETVLFSALPSSRVLTAVLHGREEEMVIRSIYPEIADRGGAALVSMELCVNGTAGCWQEFWRYAGASWKPLPDPLDALTPRVRRAFQRDSSHQTRSPRIDVRTLRGTAQIAVHGDANCCPSYRAEFRLALVGDRFRVLELRVVANEREKIF
jgi:hypothetical protein